MLYIVSTPIGNLKDISERAISTLKNVDLIIVEDIQDARRLLSFYNITGKSIIKYNDRNKNRVTDKIIKLLEKNDAAYITSAGTPGISDPGADLVRYARENNIEINVIPGPSAITSAISVSGINMREFTFIGFLPRKKGKIEKIFVKHKENKDILIFFESPYRIAKSLEILKEVASNCHVFIAKEMTKIFENYFIGTSLEVLKQLGNNPKNTKGEFVVIAEFNNKKQI